MLALLPYLKILFQVLIIIKWMKRKWLWNIRLSTEKKGREDIIIWGQKYAILQGSNYFHFSLGVSHQLSSNGTK